MVIRVEINLEFFSGYYYVYIGFELFFNLPSRSHRSRSRSRSRSGSRSDGNRSGWSRRWCR